MKPLQSRAVTPTCARATVRTRRRKLIQTWRALFYGVQYKFEVDDVALIAGKDREVAKPTKSYRVVTALTPREF